MMQATITEPDLEDVVPPEVYLTAPSSIGSNKSVEISTESIPKNQPEDSSATRRWVVVARNRRVNKDWEKLLSLHPQNALRCYEDLSTVPMVRQPKRVFPLKGKRYKGSWEYEITGSERVFYIPDPQKLKVEVYYAGKHPKEAPTP